MTTSAKLTVGVMLALILGIALGVGGVYVYHDLNTEPPAADGAPGAPGGGGGPPGGGGEQQGPPPATVRLAPVKLETLRQRVDVVGQLREVRRVTVSAEVEGKLIEMLVEEGDSVTGGITPLARIDPQLLRLDLQQSQAQVASAQAQLDQAKLDLRQLEQLQQAGSAKPKEVDDQRTQVASMEAMLSAGLAMRDRTAEELTRVDIVAPFDGTITEKIVDVGQWVQPGDDVVRMISRGEIDAVLQVPERIVAEVRVGDDVEVLIEPLDESVFGKIVAVNPEGSNAARTFPVKVRLNDEEGKLKPGMTVTAHVPVTGEAEHLTVPRAAVQQGQTGPAVWTPVEMGGPMPVGLPVPVRVLFGTADRYAVQPNPATPQATLTAESQVVVEGAERLFPMRPLMSVDQPQKGAKVANKEPQS